MWGATANPTIANNTGITTDGSGTGTFTSSITGLTENTTYHVRAYATNADGTEYGKNREFTTKKGLGVTYPVTFTVTHNSEFVEGATISINSQKLTTNTVGVATIELANGVYPYTVSASGYVFYEGSITVSGAAVNQSVPLAQASAKMELVFNTNKSSGTTVTLPLQGTVNATVNWGDGSSDTYTEAGNQDHTYAAEGDRKSVV